MPANGAKIIAKSWVDEEFKRKLIADPRKAISEFGHDIGPLHLIVLENTRKSSQRRCVYFMFLLSTMDPWTSTGLV